MWDCNEFDGLAADASGFPLTWNELSDCIEELVHWSSQIRTGLFFKMSRCRKFTIPTYLYESLLIVDWKAKHQPVSKVVTYCPSLAQQRNKLGLRHTTLVNKDSQYPNTWDKIIKHVSFVKKKKKISDMEYQFIEIFNWFSAWPSFNMRIWKFISLFQVQE